MASLSSSARRLLNLILLALNVLLVNLLIARIAPSWDCTANAAFSVSDDTREILRHLEQRVTISVLMAPPEQYTPSLYYHVKELLTRYQQLSKRIVVRAIDLDADPERALLEANALGVGPQLLRRGVVVVTSGQRRRQIPVDQLATRQHGRIVDSSADAAISAAIVAISERKRRQVCLTEGHGEPGVDDLGDGGLSRLAVAIENDNFVLKRLPPSALADLSPRRCSVLAVIGPTRELLAAESQRIAAFLERGGALLAMIGPVIDGDGRHFRPLPLKELLVRWGAISSRYRARPTGRRRRATVAQLAHQHLCDAPGIGRLGRAADGLADGSGAGRRSGRRATGDVECRCFSCAIARRIARRGPGDSPTSTPRATGRRCCCGPTTGANRRFRFRARRAQSSPRRTRWQPGADPGKPRLAQQTCTWSEFARPPRRRRASDLRRTAAPRLQSERDRCARAALGGGVVGLAATPG